MDKAKFVRVAALVLTCALLLAYGGARQVRSQDRPAALWAVLGGEISSGGAYRLASLSWQVGGVAGSESYQLSGQRTPTLRGNGCCCTYLPCVAQDSP